MIHLVALWLLALPLVHVPAARAEAAPAAADGELTLHAILRRLPESPRCDGRTVRVVARYQVTHVERGELSSPSLLVLHRCPELGRGPSRVGAGDSGPLRVGQRHLLQLKRLQSLPRGQLLVDPFVDDPAPRYVALRTDPSRWNPRIVAVVEGGAGTNVKLAFDMSQLTVGRSPQCDLLLSAEQVAPRHLALRIVGPKLELRTTGQAQAAINGKPLRAPQLITYRDHITAGPYTLRFALFLDYKD